MSITHLPRHILCEQVLPHLSLADIRSVWRTSTVFQCIVREFLKWPSQRTSRNLHSVVVSSMLLFVDMSATGCSPRVDNSRTRSNLREHIAMIGHHLLNRIEVWGNGEECILNVLADIAGQVRHCNISLRFRTISLLIGAFHMVSRIVSRYYGDSLGSTFVSMKNAACKHGFSHYAPYLLHYHRLRSE